VLFSLVLLVVLIFVLEKWPACAGVVLRRSPAPAYGSATTAGGNLWHPARRAARHRRILQPRLLNRRCARSQLVTTPNEPATDHHTVVDQTLHRRRRRVAAFVQNLRRGHCELGVDRSPASRVASASTELASAIRSCARVPTSARPPIRCTATVITAARETGWCQCSRAMFG
jgi:hypothetical protein